MQGEIETLKNLVQLKIDENEKLKEEKSNAIVENFKLK
jgi:hypothetical protein